MTIGVDIDGVLTEMERFHFDYGTKYLVENNISYEVNDKEAETYDIFNINKNIDSDFWKKYINQYVKMPPRMFASEVLNKLHKEGNKIVIITARLVDLDYFSGYTEKKMERIVLKWLKRYNIYYDEIVFSKGKKDVDIVNYKIDIMIEDTPSNIIDLSKLTKVICFDNIYNKEIKNSDSIKRVFSWYQIYDLINKKGF